MYFRGQFIENVECFELHGGGYYLGQVFKTLDGSLMREGKGVQLADGVEYQGDWQKDSMHGDGKLVMGEEEYEGEFFEGLANGKLTMLNTGQGTYKFANGDFYSGGFLDGQLNGEGVYFTKSGDSVDGIFKEGMVMQDGIPLPPYLNQSERNNLFKKLSEGRVDIPSLLELPEPEAVALRLTVDRKWRATC